ncbi:MAG: cellulase family glycosylhydrolase [Bacteroidales bacterium]
MKRIFIYIFLITANVNLYSQPISLHPENTHYFLFKGKPTILVTSGEHYGSVINPDFNFDLYLETIHREGFNHTRIFMGDYAEAKEAFCIVHNSLSPESRKFLTPWVRSSQPGNALGGNKFDLNKWNPEYFARLHRFMKKADSLGIVVECVMFFVGMSWDDMPMNTKNNINTTSDIKANEYMTLSNGNILEYQKKYVLKLIKELNVYDNVIFNIANEPWFFNQEHEGFSSPARDETKAWVNEVSEWIVKEEKNLSKKHILSVDYCNEGRAISKEELTKYWTNISVFNHHYDKDATSVKLNYRNIPRAFSFNETGLMPIYSKAYRIQGWKYLMSGGALYNNLDFTFQVGHEDGTGKAEFSCDGYKGSGDPRVRHEISVLASFFNTIDFVHMHPSQDIFVVYFGDKEMYALANDGKQYAIYVIGGTNSWYRLNIPLGKYKVEYIDPVSGAKILEETVNHSKGDLRLDGPDYENDLAIRISRID